jgi:hypothetical protein
VRAGEGAAGAGEAAGQNTAINAAAVRRVDGRARMTAEQAAVAQAEIARLQLWVTGIAIFLGPLVGVVTTLWFQRRKEKGDARQRLFMTLMADRKNPFVSRQVAGALNTIDIAFAGDAAIIEQWHRYYALLAQPPGEARVHAWLELLTLMAAKLGYEIKQTDLDKFYIPQGHFDEALAQQEIQRELLRVLKATAAIETRAVQPPAQ